VISGRIIVDKIKDKYIKRNNIREKYNTRARMRIFFEKMILRKKLNVNTYI